MNPPDAHRSSPGPQSLVEALESAARERARQELDLDAALSEVAREEVQNRKAIDEAYRRLTALRLLRQEFEERKQQLGTEASRTEWMAVRAGLLADRARFLRRVELVSAATKERDQRLKDELSRPELGTALAEYERYHTEVEPSLQTLPPAYRRAALESHERNRRRLDPFITAASSPPDRLNLPLEAIGVIACASPANGRPEALVIVMPLPFELCREWATREEDLAATFAYRVVAAVFRLLREIGAEDAPVEYFEVHECLALQVWLGDHTVSADLREHTLDYIGRAYEDGPELRAAAVELYGVWLRPELLAEDGY